MSKKIKAIQTVYKGYKFRSRLEARWAVFFDELNIDWMYEPEGYELNDGFYYLPDFYLPHFNNGLWCEVKFDGGDFSKARQFHETTGFGILECEGTPDNCMYRLNGKIYDTENSQNHEGRHNTEYGPFYYCYDESFEHRRMWDRPTAFGNTLIESKRWAWVPDVERVFNSTKGTFSMNKAIAKAKQARFGSKGLMI